MPYRILLCDDEIHILRVAEFKLSRAGYEVCCANNGLEAWEEICRQKPDMLVTDCQMPRLDGIGLCKKIRENPTTRDLPVFMLTAKGFELSHEELREQLGILKVIHKPFSPRDLLQQIDQVCKGTAPPEQLVTNGRYQL
jgi:two-component system, OmpR family, alkaline phosphatase synthesis response regulator PhoP